jgi:hypothetical protein
MTMRWTKYFAAASVLAVSTQALALDATPDSTRIVSDPLYLPLAGQIYGQTNYSWTSTKQDTFDATGAKTSFSQITGNAIDQQFQYGVTDDLALRLDWGYDWRDVSRHLVPTGSVIRSSSGWSDPTFGVTWRAIDQGVNPFSLDLRADYSPDAFPAKAPTTVDEGTVARGGQAVDLGFTLGHETRDFTIAGLFDANYLDTRNVENQNTGGFTTAGAGWNYRLGLATQTRFSDVLSLNAGVGHTFTNNTDVFNSNTGLTHVSTGGDFTDLNAALNYHFVPNTVVGSIGYQHNFYDDTRNLFPTAPVNNDSVRNKDEDVVGVTMRYVFN